MGRMEIIKICEICGIDFVAKDSRRKCCSESCGRILMIKNRTEKNKNNSKANRSFPGTMRELRDMANEASLHGMSYGHYFAGEIGKKRYEEFINR